MPTQAMTFAPCAFLQGHLVGVSRTPPDIILPIGGLVENKPLLIRPKDPLKLLLGEGQPEVAGRQPALHVCWGQDLCQVGGVSSPLQNFPQNPPHSCVRHPLPGCCFPEVGLGIQEEKVSDLLHTFVRSWSKTSGNHGAD